MSNRRGVPRTRLWLVRRIDGSGWHIFSGSLEEMVAHINALHIESGVQHAAREVDQS
jgi:hypothetical protein